MTPIWTMAVLALIVEERRLYILRYGSNPRDTDRDKDGDTDRDHCRSPMTAILTFPGQDQSQNRLCLYAGKNPSKNNGLRLSRSLSWDCGIDPAKIRFRDSGTGSRPMTPIVPCAWRDHCHGTAAVISIGVMGLRQ